MQKLNGMDRLSRPGVAGYGGGNGGGGLGVGLPGAEIPPPAPSLQVFPWWLYPPPSGQYFYVDSFAATGAAQVIPAGTTAILAGSDLTINQGERGIIAGIALMTQNTLPTDNYFFTLLRNGGPVEGVRNLRSFSIAANGVAREYGGFVIKLQPADRVEWSVTNNGGAPVSVSVSYQGWRAATAEIERMQGGINY
jgi:hypothetical protein